MSINSSTTQTNKTTTGSVFDTMPKPTRKEILKKEILSILEAPFKTSPQSLAHRAAEGSGLDFLDTIDPTVVEPFIPKKTSKNN